MIIKSSSALRSDYSMISDLAHDEAEPIYITKNGGGDLRPGFDSLFFCSTKKRHPFRDVFFRGAGEGNRTLNASLGSSNFTTKLRPPMRPAEPANDIILSFVQNFNYFSWNPAAFLF